MLFAALASMAILLTHGSKVGAEEPDLFFTIGTGTVSGLYADVGKAICRLLVRLAGETQGVDRTNTLRCSAQLTGGSVDNVNQLANDRLDFAIVQSDVAYAAPQQDQPGACSWAR
ncbi:MAG: hypothetical protein HC834_00285 [Rhodospirillales bacterium]|nr:hypothetical protein [Rhodospirillales bacterium]